MPYSTNPDRLVQLLPYMAHLVQGQNCFWNLEGRKVTAQVFAYRIREALTIARLHADKFPQVAAIADDVVIEVDNHCVLAKFGKVLNAPLPQSIADYAAQQAQFASERPVVAPMQIRYTLETVSALWAKRQGTSVNLPAYIPTNDELLRLYDWASVQEPPVMLMPSDAALTLVAHDDELEGMNWTPDEMEDS